MRVAQKGTKAEMCAAVQKRLSSRPIAFRDPAIVCCETDISGRTALHIAAAAGNLDTLQYMLDIGGPIDYFDVDGYTALHLAAHGGHTLCVDALLRVGADTESEVARGKHASFTPLLLAAHGGHVETTKLLITTSETNTELDDTRRDHIRSTSRVMDIALSKHKSSRLRPNAEQLLKDHEIAALKLQRWWRATFAPRKSMLNYHATVIQAGFRGWRIRAWIRPIRQRHRAAHQRRLAFDAVLHLCDSDKNIPKIEELLRPIDLHTDLSTLSSSPELLNEEGLEETPSESSKQRVYASTKFYEKVGSMPILVKSKPSLAASAVGVIHGDAQSTVMQGITSLGDNTVTADGYRWLRLANPRKMFGNGEAWCIQEVCRSGTCCESASLQYLRLKPHVDYTCMSYGTWMRSGITIPNYCKTPASDGDCAHFYSVTSEDHRCIFCGERPAGDTGHCSLNQRDKPTPPYNVPDFKAMQSQISPLATYCGEELLLKSFHSKANGVLRWLLKHEIGEVGKPLPNRTTSVLHEAAVADRDDVIMAAITFARLDVIDALMVPDLCSNVLLAAASSGAQASTLCLMELYFQVSCTNASREHLLNKVVQSSVQHCMWQVLEELVESGHVLDWSAGTGNSPIACAVAFAANENDNSLALPRAIRTIDRLIELGCSVNSVNAAGETALMIAAECESPTLAIELLRRGADDTIVSEACGNAWSRAAGKGRVATLSQMRMFKMDLAAASLKAGDGRTAYQVSQNNFGADIKDTVKSALEFSIRAKDFSTLDFFIEHKCSLAPLCKDIQNIVTRIMDANNNITRECSFQAAAVKLENWLQKRSKRNSTQTVADEADILRNVRDALRLTAGLTEATMDPMHSSSTDDTDISKYQRSAKYATIIVKTMAQEAMDQLLTCNSRAEVLCALNPPAGAWEDFEETCDNLAQIISANELLRSRLRSRDEDMSAHVACVDLLLREIACSPSVKSALRIFCRSRLRVSNVSSRSSTGGCTRLVLSLPWDHEPSADVLLRQIQSIESLPQTLAAHLADKLAVPLLNKVQGILIRGLLERDCDRIRTTQGYSTDKARKPQIPSNESLGIVATLVGRLKAGDHSVAQVMSAINELVDIAKVKDLQFSKNQGSQRDAACRFIGVCFPDMARKCDICFEPIEEPVAVCSQSGGEHFKKLTCNHEYCKECVKSWVTSCIDDRLGQIRCPHESCKFMLYPDDVRRICGASSVTYTRYMAYTTASYKDRLLDFVENVGSEWVKSNTRLCPSCHVVMERSAGCNSMLCTCGHRFNWNSEALRVTDDIIDKLRTERAAETETVAACHKADCIANSEAESGGSQCRLAARVEPSIARVQRVACA